MKNDRIIAAWNAIEPDGAADARMLSAILHQNQSAQKRKEKENTMFFMKRILIPFAACLVLLAVIGVVGANRDWFGTNSEPVELEAESSGAVHDVPYTEHIFVIDDNINAAFGYLFPTEIAEGYVLDENGIELSGNSPLILESKYRALQAIYYNAELDDTLLIRAVSNGYLGVDTFGTVLHGDPKTDGTRQSMIFYENDGITILYLFEKTDIATMDPEAAERFYAMVHSARCFDRNSNPSYEGNDEIDIDE